MATQKINSTQIQAQQSWQTPTFVNSWTNFGAPYQTARFTKDALGFVHMEGLVKSGASGSTIFTLPAGYRPVNGLYFAANASGGFADLVVSANGEVKPYNVGASSVTNYVTITITFKAEQ